MRKGKQIGVIFLVILTVGLAIAATFVGFQLSQEDVAPDDSAAQATGYSFGPGTIINVCGNNPNDTNPDFSSCNGCTSTGCTGYNIQIYRCFNDDELTEENGGVECVANRVENFLQGDPPFQFSTPSISYSTYFEGTTNIDGNNIDNSCFVYQVDVFDEAAPAPKDFVVWQGDRFEDPNCFPQPEICPNGQIYFNNIDGFAIDGETQAEIILEPGQSPPTDISFYYQLNQGDTFNGNFIVRKTVLGQINNFEEQTVVLEQDNNYNIPFPIEAGFGYRVKAILDGTECDSSQLVIRQSETTPTPTPPPTSSPTPSPTSTPLPTSTNTPVPTFTPTPTITLTPTPSPSPSPSPTPDPTITPTITPTPDPSVTPTETPTPTDVPICGDPCDPDDSATCPEDHTCDAATERCVLNQCLDNPDLCDETKCTTVDPRCGDSCDPENPNSCPEDHTCDPDSNQCALNACIDDPSLCSADQCFIVPETSLSDDNGLSKVIFGGALTFIGLFMMLVLIMYTKQYSKFNFIFEKSIVWLLYKLGYGPAVRNKIKDRIKDENG